MPSPGCSLPPRRDPRILLQAACELGPRQLSLYLLYQAGLRTGWLRRTTPIYDWDDRPLRTWLRPAVPHDPAGYLAYRTQPPGSPRFFFDPAADLASPLRAALADDPARLLEEAGEILQGRFRLFGGPAVSLGYPPDWGAFAPLGQVAPPPPLDLGRHWAAYSPEALAGDIKLLWECSRFGWAFPLGRAYRLTGDSRYFEGFWVLVETWRAANRPNAGPHWTSGQEVALRLMALSFAIHAFAPALARNPELLVRLAELVAVHADRIPATLAYSRSLNNNHVISEAAGLYTAGLLFPEFRLSERWRSLGRRRLASALQRQVFPDGGQLQYSINYHRLVLQAGLWAARLAELNAEPLPVPALDALRRASGFLDALTDRQNGRAPNLGPNDGAQILPLTTCPFDDHRPTLQMARAFFAQPALPPGPWDEACFWLSLAPTTAPITGHGPESALQPPAGSFPQAGLHFLRGHSSQAALRCAHFSSRPGHSDQLHLDLWWHGMNIARDAGSYFYKAPHPWDNALAAAVAHNTLLVDGLEPMSRAGRFLWLGWDQGVLLGRWRAESGRLEVFAAEHDGYRRLGLSHRRTVARVGDDLWLVVDDLLGKGEHTARGCWLLPDWPSPVLKGERLSLGLSQGYLVLQVEAPGDLMSAPIIRQGVYRAGTLIAGEGLPNPCPIWGWYSPTYAFKEAALSLVSEISGPLPLRLLTWLSLGEARGAALAVEWSSPGIGPAAFSRLDLEGEHLEIAADGD